MSANARAIFFMIIAVFGFTSMDAAAKYVAEGSNAFNALWARYVGQIIVVSVNIAPRLRETLRTRFPLLQLLRSIFLMGATGCFYIGLTHIGLAESTAIMDVNPVLITLGAALFLGERLGPRRVFGILAAMAGAMIIIRPGSGILSAGAIWPLLAACCYAGYALATRYVGARENPWTSLFYAALLGAILLTALLPWQWQRPTGDVAVVMVLLGLLGTVAQLFMVRALSLGEAAMLAPFGYVGLVNATFWGIVVFGEIPDLWTILGALVIVGAGVYVWHRETRGIRPALPAEAKTPPEGL